MQQQQALDSLKERIEAQALKEPKAEEPVRGREYEAMASDVLKAIREEADKKGWDRPSIMQCRTSSKMSFAGAHFLPNYQGPCANLHGHTWTVQIELEWDVIEMPESGILIDFHALKAIVEPLDHGVAILNHYIPVPTAENIVAWIGNAVLELATAINCADCHCYEFKVTVWESPDDSITGTFYVDPLLWRGKDE